MYPVLIKTLLVAKGLIGYRLELTQNDLVALCMWRENWTVEENFSKKKGKIKRRWGIDLERKSIGF